MQMERDRASILQNLRDAGLEESAIEQFSRLLQSGTAQGQLALLAKQRALLLENIHNSQSRLDCLDHLIYNMKKETEKPV